MSYALELTAPYGHNGYFAELRDVVRFYVTRDIHPELWYPTDGVGAVQVANDLPARHRANINTTEVPYDRMLGQPPRLTDEEIDAVVSIPEDAHGSVAIAPRFRSPARVLSAAQQWKLRECRGGRHVAVLHLHG